MGQSLPRGAQAIVLRLWACQLLGSLRHLQLWLVLRQAVWHQARPPNLLVLMALLVRRLPLQSPGESQANLEVLCPQICSRALQLQTFLDP
jgi:hypothetical protein